MKVSAHHWLHNLKGLSPEGNLLSITRIGSIWVSFQVFLKHFLASISALDIRLQNYVIAWMDGWVDGRAVIFYPFRFSLFSRLITSFFYKYVLKSCTRLLVEVMTILIFKIRKFKSDSRNIFDGNGFSAPFKFGDFSKVQLKNTDLSIKNVKNRWSPKMILKLL